MRSVYREYLYVPRNGQGKVSEKVLFTRVAITIGVLIACLIAMSLTAYAYFSHSASSGVNIIKSANFNASVTVLDAEGTTCTLTVTGTNRYQAKLKANTLYSVTLKAEGTAETGFGVIRVQGNDNVYHTQQIGNVKVAESGIIEEITFKLELSSDATVEFFAHWGTSSFYDGYKNKGTNNELYIIDGESLQVVVNSVPFEIKEDNKQQNAESPVIDSNEDSQSGLENTTEPQTEEVEQGTENTEETPTLEEEQLVPEEDEEEDQTQSTEEETAEVLS